MAGMRPRVLMIALIGAWAFGLFFADKLSDKFLRNIDTQTSALHRFEPLRPFLQGVAEADFLLEDRSSISGRAKRVMRRPRFRVQYVLMPTVIGQVDSLEDVVRRASERERYFLVRDPACDWSVKQIRNALRSVGRSSGRELAVQTTKSGASVFSLMAEQAP